MECGGGGTGTGTWWELSVEAREGQVTDWHVHEQSSTCQMCDRLLLVLNTPLSAALVMGPGGRRDTDGS